ncbi:hypothetical protein [Candidatus Nitronereus thalassa]|uniref:hypothetical protein n=1 Tax=Candidatus Nitronereus thalassa TaxID=3020898 RepID=UPI003B968746
MSSLQIFRTCLFIMSLIGLNPLSHAQLYFLPNDNDTTSVAFHPDGKYFLSAGGFDGTIRLWNKEEC